MNHEACLVPFVKRIMRLGEWQKRWVDHMSARYTWNSKWNDGRQEWMGKFRVRGFCLLVIVWKRSAKRGHREIRRSKDKYKMMRQEYSPTAKACMLWVVIMLRSQHGDGSRCPNNGMTANIFKSENVENEQHYSNDSPQGPERTWKYHSQFYFNSNWFSWYGEAGEDVQTMGWWVGTKKKNRSTWGLQAPKPTLCEKDP